MKKARSLRAILNVSIVALTLVSLVTGASLVVVTNSLDRVSRRLSQSVESIRVTEEAEIALLVHARLHDPLARAQSEASVRRNLRDAKAFVGTEQEGQVLDRSMSAIEAYFLATSEGPPDREKVATRLEAAFRGIARLADINVARSQEVREEARRLNRLAEVISIVAMFAFLVAVAAVLWWLNAKAFRPSFELAQAMTSFGGGNFEARAREEGPAELREMATQFNQMADRLAAQRESQAAFLAGVAHDLRNPLNALKMSTATVRADEPLPPEHRVRKTLAVVNRQVGLLQRMVSDFLDTARIEAGGLVLSVEPYDLRDLGRSVVALFVDTTTKHQIELEVPHEPVLVPCDPARLEQVLTNLTSNAIKYSPEGGEIQIRVKRLDERACISVSDQGMGISPDDQAHLFEPFRRIKPRNHEVPGVGLGLFVSKRIVDAHRGSIEISSAPGRGSTFTLCLPLVSDAELSVDSTRTPDLDDETRE